MVRLKCVRRRKVRGRREGVAIEHCVARALVRCGWPPSRLYSRARLLSPREGERRRGVVAKSEDEWSGLSRGRGRQASFLAAPALTRRREKMGSRLAATALIVTPKHCCSVSDWPRLRTQLLIAKPTRNRPPRHPYGWSQAANHGLRIFM